MNKNTYLIISDTDSLIVPYLTPPSVLTLHAVNKHYARLLKDKRNEFIAVKTSLVDACAHGYLWIAKWIYSYRIETFEKLHQTYLCDGVSYSKIHRIKILSPQEKMDANQRALFSNHVDVAEWVVEADGKLVVFDPNSIYDPLRMDEYNIDTVKWLIAYGERVNIPINVSRLFQYACGDNLEIAKYVFNTYNDIDIHDDDEHAFYRACTSNNFQSAKWLLKIGEESGNRINIHTEEDYIFGKVCKYTGLDIAKWLLELGEKSYGLIDIHAGNEEAFVMACEENNIPLVCWLIKKGEKSYGRIDIHFDYEAMFSIACNKEYVDLAKYLVKIGEKSHGLIDIHDCEGSYCTFEYACKKGHTRVVKWLIELSRGAYGPYDPLTIKSGIWHAKKKGHLLLAEWLENLN